MNNENIEKTQYKIEKKISNIYFETDNDIKIINAKLYKRN